MYLYLLTWEFEQYDRECEWTHFVSDKESLSYEDQLEVVEQFMRDNHEESPEDYEIENLWCNTVNMVDGHKITVEAKQ